MLTVTVDSFQDRGLLGVVAHPQFSSNGLIYVYYTVPASQGTLHYRLSRFTVNGNTAQGEVVLADLPAVTPTPRALPGILPRPSHVKPPGSHRLARIAPVTDTNPVESRHPLRGGSPPAAAQHRHLSQ